MDMKKILLAVMASALLFQASAEAAVWLTSVPAAQRLT